MINLPWAESVFLCIYHFQDLDYHLILKHNVASDFSRARWECVIEKKENLGILFRALYNKCLVKLKPLNFQFVSLKLQKF